MAQGSIRKRVGRTGTISWLAVVDVPDGSGKRRQASKTFRRKADAEAWLGEMLGNGRRGLAPESGTTLAAYLTHDWLPFYKERHKISSYRKREKDCRVHLIPALGAARLTALTPARIQRLYRDLGTTLAPNTVHGIASTLDAALNQAVKWELLHRNPARGAEKPAVARRPPTVWTPEQTRAFLAAEDDPAWRCLFALLTVTGMRKAEVLALVWDDLDLAAGVLHIRHALVWHGKETGFVVGPPKTRDSVRNVALPTALVAMLREHRHERDTGRTPLFIGRNGVLTPSAIDWRFRRTTARAGLPTIRVHDLRHTNATIALGAGVPLKVISERLGHADIGITSRVYAHVTRELDRSAANVLGDVLLGFVQDAAEV